MISGSGPSTTFDYFSRSRAYMLRKSGLDYRYLDLHTTVRDRSADLPAHLPRPRADDPGREAPFRKQTAERSESCGSLRRCPDDSAFGDPALGGRQVGAPAKGRWHVRPRAAISPDSRFVRGFSEEVREQGKVVVTTQCEARIVGEPPTELVEALQLRSSSKVAYLERLRIVNALPAAVQQAWIPVALCPGLFSEPLVDDSLYATFRAKYGIVLSWAEQETSAVAARDHLAQLLKVSRGSPLLYVVRKTFDDRNTPIEYVRSWMPQGHSLLSTIKA